jgi:MerR family copper efflux transcriptional regulator
MVFSGVLNMALSPLSAVNIGDAATASGVTAKMIRHYEDIGLIAKARRTSAGYRMYTPDDVHVLRFVRHSRSLGFSMDEIAALLGLWRNKRRPSRKVRELAQSHIDDLDRKIAEMQAMRATLTRLVDCCHGDDRPDCPILEELSRDEGPAVPVKKPASKKASQHECH